MTVIAFEEDHAAALAVASQTKVFGEEATGEPNC
jgi:hypothetical protein